MAKKTVKASIQTTPAGIERLSIDGVRLQLDGEGKGEKELQLRMSDYTFSWFVKGPEGATYTVAITAPDEAKFSHTATLDELRKDVGVRWFKLKGN